MRAIIRAEQANELDAPPQGDDEPDIHQIVQQLIIDFNAQQELLAQQAAAQQAEVDAPQAPIQIQEVQRNRPLNAVPDVPQPERIPPAVYPQPPAYAGYPPAQPAIEHNIDGGENNAARGRGQRS
ncbi:hypothetical protein TVAG_485530 [Trichomonas vaginalis G3]|uniref:Uncharacterized protein n=1 Tax=Trichomonas vaginalis (strain ATCC PRA-98 / G3) TaxID=412133 RepID=A2G683_TRIV3|nr:hypothetical protein TVAGG3_0113430 [Trichomonas vaginalis G3]EAX87336.1 hypothetical protein TVAG_485530 [Trichomonas vaginalis G3]KAI5545066.1 hypothetical protein TVAGG3_0113430 [Trichomonas vaginalis G3]|eukprot:XP_001300266.1 hypothetical protein [Trichomonas vaginalis G3]